MREKDQNKIFFEYGKVPPQSMDAEEVVLGALLIEDGGMAAIADRLKPQHFYTDAHQKIYKAIFDMHNRGEHIDLVTIVHELKARNELELIGGAYYISTLTQRIGSAANIEVHAEIIISKYVNREIIRVTSEYNKKAYENSSNGLDLIDDIGTELIGLTDGIINDVEDISSISDKNFERITKIRSGEITSFGIKTDYIDLDNVIGSLNASDLVIVAARPSMGKTSFMLGLVKNIAIDKGIPCGVLSYEMSNEQLELRLETSFTGIPYYRLQNGKFNDTELELYEKARSTIKQSKIYVSDDSRNNIDSIRTKAIQLKNKYGIMALFIDYLQLIPGNERGDNREQQISKISRGLKSLAKELDIPIVALSQLNRDTEKSNNGEPKLSGLRDSGAIEQDADSVMFLYRPKYYGLEEITRYGEQINTDNLCVIDVAKNRNGPTGKLLMTFYEESMKFTDYNTGSDLKEFTEPAKQEEMPF